MIPAENVNHPESAEPAEVLGLSPGASAEQVRAAYLEKVRQYPPDRAPEMFERIRAAYDTLRDPRLRARAMFEGENPLEPFAALLPPNTGGRRRIGLAPWLEVIKENRETK